MIAPRPIFITPNSKGSQEEAKLKGDFGKYDSVDTTRASPSTPSQYGKPAVSPASSVSASTSAVFTNPEFSSDTDLDNIESLDSQEEEEEERNDDDFVIIFGLPTGQYSVKAAPRLSRQEASYKSTMTV
ncbi:uncharacterized protein RSE6_07363 [Rhynchosporium secalis]|uniref:Uncharacterized protein n=1 Tax=Rhynchosporium secalis TaxID=38038 RepID=A0A1E1MCM8_RHYSE|nr:uncharacterized protein RSE6_07363 [Rhynchosporium secalis]